MKKHFIITLLLSLSIGLFAQKGVTFKIKNAGFNVNGSFEKFTSDIVYNPSDLAQSKFNGTIMVTSINTGINKRDEHLRKPDYFDVATFPELIFKSASVKSISAEKIEVTGQLTIKKVSKTVTMPVTIKKVGNQNEFVGSLEINRRDYGVGDKSFILSDKVVITITVLN
jgi:polyisoprenoid-binding protein YceI